MQRKHQYISVDLFGREPASRFIRDAGSLAKHVSYRVIPESGIIRANFLVKRDKTIYQRLLDKLTKLNRWYRANGFDIPLYQSGVRYHTEPKQQEIWQSWPVLLMHRLGDCEDLAPARASEIAGARALIKKVGERHGGGRLFHIVTLLPNGRIEDPSRVLGMKG